MGRIQDDLRKPGVELRETHISWVFLTDGEVFKVKKPVSMGFLDFSTLERRRAACEDEVRLNRRLSEDVYRGVVPVYRDDEGLHRLEGPGEIADWAVHMRRLPDEERADLRLGAGRLDAGLLERVAVKLARFHAASKPTEAAARFGTVEAIRVNVEENFEQTRANLGDYLDEEQAREVESWQRRFLSERADLFTTRIQEGRVRDGHGDLRLEHVYIDDSGAVTVIDCIEFNERFRFADVCADVVFLAMDLAWHARVDLAERFLAYYARESNDFDLYPLVDFYESYRAFVRGKIATFVASSPEASLAAKEKAAEEARRYFLLALASERRSLLPPAVVAVGGIIASGKSTVADRIGAAMSAPIVEADRTRKHLAGIAPDTPVSEGAFQGLYAPEMTRKVYQELVRRAERVLRSRRPVVLDASFRARAFRDDARRLARELGVPFYFVECRAGTELLRERLRARERERGVSDGRLAIFDDFVASWQPVEEIPESEHLVLDTGVELAETERVLRERLPVWPRGFTG